MDGEDNLWLPVWDSPSKSDLCMSSMVMAHNQDMPQMNLNGFVCVLAEFLQQWCAYVALGKFRSLHIALQNNSQASSAKETSIGHLWREECWTNFLQNSPVLCAELQEPTAQADKTGAFYKVNIHQVVDALLKYSLACWLGNWWLQLDIESPPRGSLSCQRALIRMSKCC